MVMSLHLASGLVTSLTVTVALQVELLPWPSLAVRVTMLAPILAQVKEFGLTETRLTVPQLSEPDRKTSAGAIEAVPEASRGRVMFLQAIDGGVVSFTVKVAVQVLLLFAASLTVTVIVCGPRPTSVPAAGLCVLINEPEA